MKAGVHVIHFAGDLLGKGELTQCGIKNPKVGEGPHMVGPVAAKYVNCRECLQKGKW